MLQTWPTTRGSPVSTPTYGEFSPGKPDLCSDQTTPFGRSKGGGTYRYRPNFSISHDHCAGYFGRSPIRVSTKSVAENCLARQGWPVKAGTVDTP